MISSNSIRVTGRLLDLRGQPVNGARATLLAENVIDGVQPEHFAIERRVRTNRRGRFVAVLPIDAALGWRFSARHVRKRGRTLEASTALGQPLYNLARDARVRTSAGSATSRRAVDGNPRSAWRAGSRGAQWIEIDFQVATVSEFRVHIGGALAAATRFQISRYVPYSVVMEEISARSGLGSVLRFTRAPDELLPWGNMTTVRIEVFDPPPGFAVREVEIIGRCQCVA